MTKQQKVGACCGAVFGICALALGWFLYSAYAERIAAEEGDPESGEEGLAAAKAKNKAYYTQSTAAKPFPSPAAIAAVASNEAAYVNWRGKAIEVAARGDCPPPPEDLSETVFKQRLYNEVTRMQKLPGGSAGRICEAKFLFGFDQYLGEAGKTPQRHELPQLYAQLGVITNVVDILAKSGVVEVKRFDRPAMEDSAAAAEASRGQSRAGAKGKGKDKSAKGAASADEPRRYDFRLEYTARSAAFVKVLNELAKSTRFYVVDDFKFRREGEALRDKLKRIAESSASGGRSAGRRRRGDDQKKEQEDDGVATDPARDQPLLVSMKLTVYDFGRGRVQPAEAAQVENASGNQAAAAAQPAGGNAAAGNKEGK